MGGKKGVKGIQDFFVQSLYEGKGVGAELTRRAVKRVPALKAQSRKGGFLEEPEKRDVREAAAEAAKEKVAARGRIKPMPDPEAGKAERRKSASRRRQRRGGRASTVLSGAKETLG